jgi:hypothetical protein
VIGSGTCGDQISSSMGLRRSHGQKRQGWAGRKHGSVTRHGRTLVLEIGRRRPHTTEIQVPGLYSAGKGWFYGEIQAIRSHDAGPLPFSGGRWRGSGRDRDRGRPIETPNEWIPGKGKDGKKDMLERLWSSLVGTTWERGTGR